MDLCNYNWNISPLKLLQRPRIYVADLTFSIYRGTENFGVGMENEYSLWIEREYEEVNFRYAFIDITIRGSDGFLAHYSFDSKYKKIRMYFHSKGWWL